MTSGLVYGAPYGARHAVVVQDSIFPENANVNISCMT